MAANVFVEMPQRNRNKIAAFLIYALLEWILIILLLFNSLFSHLIQKFAKHFSLKPSCTWCTRLDQAKVHRSNVCASHGIEISKLSYCSNHCRLAESKILCSDCSSFSMNDGLNIMLENNEERITDVCSCCDANLGSKEDDESLYITNNMLLEDEEEESDGFICIELIDNSQSNNDLYEELEKERKAAAISANQTMAMINKLQEEKSAMQMEALQYQRMMEEQAEYDQEALQLLNDLVFKREKEKQVLENELQLYRNYFSDFEGENEGISLNSVDKFDEVIGNLGLMNYV